MRVIRGVGRFVYDFVIGDDWKIAAAVAIALAATAALLLSDAFSDGVVAVLGGILVIVLFTASLLIDVRGDRPD